MTVTKSMDYLLGHYKSVYRYVTVHDQSFVCQKYIYYYHYYYYYINHISMITKLCKKKLYVYVAIEATETVVLQ